MHKKRAEHQDDCVEAVQPGVHRGALWIRCLRRQMYWQEHGGLRRGGRVSSPTLCSLSLGPKRRAWSMVCCFTRFQALERSAVHSREHTRGNADVQRPSEMLKGLQSPLCSSSHPLPSLSASEMQRNSLSHAAPSFVIILPNAVPQGDGGEM